MRITPVGITAVENLTPDSQLHGEEKESVLEYLIYFLTHKKKGLFLKQTSQTLCYNRDYYKKL